MASKKRAGILTALALAAGIAMPAYAGNGKKLNDNLFWALVPDAIEQNLRDLPSDTDRLLNCLGCDSQGNKVRQHTSRRTTTHTTARTQRTTQRPAPRPTPQPVPTLNDMIDARWNAGWCTPGYDYALITPASLPQKYTDLGYEVIMLQRPDTDAAFWERARDFKIHGYELRSMPKSADGMYHVKGIVDAQIVKLTTKHGKNVVVPVGEPVGQILDIYGPDCEAPKPAAPTSPAPTSPAAPVSPGVPTAPKPPEDTDYIKPLPNAGPWSHEFEYGQISNSLETGYFRTINGKETFVPVEKALEGHKAGYQARYATPNTDVRLRIAGGSVDDSTQGSSYLTPTEGMTFTSIEGVVDKSFTDWVVRPMFSIKGGYKTNNFNEGMGELYREVTQKVTNGYVGGQLGLQFGNQDGSHLEVLAGGMRHNMQFQEPGRVSSDPGRADGVNENTLMGTIGGELYFDKHFRAFGEANIIKPMADRAANPNEIYKSGTAHNYNVGLGYIFRPEAHHPIEVFGKYQNAIEDATIGKSPFHSTGDGFLFGIRIH